MKRLEKVDKNQLAVFTTDPILGALIASLVSQDILRWEISSPGDIDEVSAEDEESILFWVDLVPVREEQPQ